MAVVNNIETHDLISKEAGFMLDSVADSIGLVNLPHLKVSPSVLNTTLPSQLDNSDQP